MASKCSAQHLRPHVLFLARNRSSFHNLSVRHSRGELKNVSYWTRQGTTPMTAERKNSSGRTNGFERARYFHTTPPRRDPVLGTALASILKTSTSIEFARLVTKVALTFVPILAVTKHLSTKILHKIIKDNPELVHKREHLERKIRGSVISYRTLLAVPIVFFCLTFIASLERTPLSGRWRVILLSPEEEDSILEQLQGDGWYRAVFEVISQDGPPKIIPPTDWRYQVVETILRRLERTIPILAAEKSADLPWPDRDPDDIPFPPPAKYPLKPRPAAREYLRWFCDSLCSDAESSSTKLQRPSASSPDDVDSPHLIPGPPYNLILVDRPDCDNAFSFGFGSNGGGIVVYSGFLDRVFGEGMVFDATSPNTPAPPRSMASEFIGSLLAFSRPSSSTAPRSREALTSTPRELTEEQLSQIAILLSHELSHLILSHHLESLSAGTVFIPGTASIFSDVLRAVVFPITMVFGPFVNDAVADLGKVGAGELVRLSEYCTSMALEFEADAVSARILAHAGFDARAAISFWKHRRDAELSECTPSRAAENARYFDDNSLAKSSKDGTESNSSLATKLARRIMSAAHPAHEARLLRLKSELQRWEMERTKALRKRERMLRREHWKKEIHHKTAGH